MADRWSTTRSASGTVQMQRRVIVTPKEKHNSVSPEPGGRECRFARDGGVGDRLKADRVSLTYPLSKWGASVRRQGEAANGAARTRGGAA